MNPVSGLYETTLETMLEANKAGAAYWNRNKPRDATREGLNSVARSCGWHGKDCVAWVDGFYGAVRRDFLANMASKK